MDSVPHSPVTARLLCKESMPVSQPRFSLVSVRMPESTVYIIRNSKSKTVEEVHYTAPSAYCKPVGMRMSPIPMVAVNLLPIINDMADDEKVDEEVSLFDDSFFDGACLMTCECEAASGCYEQLPELSQYFEADDLDGVEAISSQSGAELDDVQPILSQDAAELDDVQPISSQSTDTSFRLDLN